MCQMDVLYGKSLIINFLNKLLKKRTAIMLVVEHDHVYKILLVDSSPLTSFAKLYFFPTQISKQN